MFGFIRRRVSDSGRAHDCDIREIRTTNGFKAGGDAVSCSSVVPLTDRYG